MAEGHDVIRSAPYSGQSGTSGQIAFLTPIGPTLAASPGGTLPAGSPGVGQTSIAPQQFYVDGSPAAAALYGIDVAATDRWGAFPELVVSGPNEGNNLGIITPHPGTVGAAVTSLNKGIPTIAPSAAGEGEQVAEVVAMLAVKPVAALQSDSGVALPPGVGLNVNTPEIDPARSGVDDFTFRLTRIGDSANFGLRFYADLGSSPTAVGFGIPADIGLPGVAVEIPPTAAGCPDDSDPRSESHALGENVVTVSPIQGTYAAADAVREALGESLQGSLSTSGSPVRADGDTISWPDDGWYQVQTADTWVEVCGGATSCTVEPGAYNVIDHTRGVRYENIVVERFACHSPADAQAPHMPFNFDLIAVRWNAASQHDAIGREPRRHAEPRHAALGARQPRRAARGRAAPCGGARAAAMLQLTLPDTAFVHVGEELGLPDFLIPAGREVDPWG